MARRLPDSEQLGHDVLVQLDDDTYQRLLSESERREQPVSMVARLLLDEALSDTPGDLELPPGAPRRARPCRKCQEPVDGSAKRCPSCHARKPWLSRRDFLRDQVRHAVIEGVTAAAIVSALVLLFLLLF